MGEICDRCGLEKGTSLNDIDAYQKCRGGVTCWQRGYDRSQAALAAARRECEGLRAKMTELAEALASAADDIDSRDTEGFREALREGAVAATEVAE